MAGEAQLITLGGTLLMKPEAGQGHVPFYTVRDIALDKYLQLLGNRRPIPEAAEKALLEARKLLLEHGEAAYADIGRHMTQVYSMSDRDAYATVYAHAVEGVRVALGYSGDAIPMPYGPIDAINFDIGMHYPALREAVLATIRRGNIPVIAGGTDTMRFYGSLLAEDLKQLHENGHIPHLPPVIIATSMLAYGDSDPQAQTHVYRILKAARIAAREAADKGLAGVYALLPDDIEVTGASLLDMQKPTDKISAVLPKAFVGTEALRIDPNEPVNGYVYDKGDPRLTAEGMADESAIPPYQQQMVTPPLEAGNTSLALVETLFAIYRNPKAYPYKAIILKGDLRNALPGEFTSVLDLSAALTARGIQVYCVNDPVADPTTRTLLFDPTFHDPHDKYRQRAIDRAGIICVDGMTSTQLTISAGMLDGQSEPVHFVRERAAARAAAEASLVKHPLDEEGLLRRFNGVSEKHFGKTRASAVAIEYMPDSAAYDTFLKLAAKEKIGRVVSLNCSDGAMGEQHTEALRRAKYNGTRVIATFKYAGTNYPGFPTETASLTRYQPAVRLAQSKLVIPGETASPHTLLDHVKERSRG